MPTTSHSRRRVRHASEGVTLYVGDHVRGGVFIQRRQGAMTGEQLGRSAPLSVPELLETLGTAGFPWWVAGGHAFDLFLGRTTRHHDDLDIEILGRDQHRVQRLLASLSWDLHVAAGGRLRQWRESEWLAAGANSVWRRLAFDQPWLPGAHACRERQPQLGVSPQSRHRPTIGGGWATHCRRRALSRPDHPAAVQGEQSPPKDIADFNAVLGAPPSAKRAWLASALSATHPHHPWLAQLRDGANP